VKSVSSGALFPYSKGQSRPPTQQNYKYLYNGAQKSPTPQKH
jgi:hypothetical protein